MISWWPSCPNTEIWISSSPTGEITLGECWRVITLMAYGAQDTQTRASRTEGCLFITDKNKFVICIVDNRQQIHQKTRFGPAFLRVWHPYVATWRQENSRRHICGWRLWLVSAKPNVRGVRHQLSRWPCDQHETFLLIHTLTCRGETPKLCKMNVKEVKMCCFPEKKYLNILEGILHPKMKILSIITHLRSSSDQIQELSGPAVSNATGTFKA